MARSKSQKAWLRLPASIDHPFARTSGFTLVMPSSSLRPSVTLFIPSSLSLSLASHKLPIFSINSCLHEKRFHPSRMDSHIPYRFSRLVCLETSLSPVPFSPSFLLLPLSYTSRSLSTSIHKSNFGDYINSESILPTSSATPPRLCLTAVASLNYKGWIASSTAAARYGN